MNNVIQNINETFEANIEYLQNNTYGIMRKAIKLDNGKKKTYPAVTEVRTDLCNKDTEILLTPNRNRKSILFWEIIGQVTREEMAEDMDKLKAVARCYIWLNTALINKNVSSATSYMSDLYANLPSKISVIGFHAVLVTNPKFTPNDTNFKQFSFDDNFTRGDFTAFTFDIELHLYTSKNCIINIENQNINECEELIS